MIENDYEPTTPVVTEHTPRSTQDPNEFLLSDSEISEDETSEDYIPPDPSSVDDDIPHPSHSDDTNDYDHEEKKND